jgi:hypothetical protein
MPKTIPLNVPVTKLRGKKTTLTVEHGIVAHLPVGDQTVKFVLQLDKVSGKPFALTHFASGAIVGRLNGVKVSHLVARGHNARLTDRQAAELLLARIVDNLGAEAVLAKFASVPVLNP